MKRLRDRFRHILFAAGGFVPLADVGSQSSKLSGLYDSADLSSFVNGLFKFGIAIGAIVAVLRIAYAGYLYMGQSDMWSTKGKAKAILGDVTIGLLLLLAIYLILFQINPDIVKLNALKNIKPIPAVGASGKDSPAVTEQNLNDSGAINTGCATGHTFQPITGQCE